MKRSTKKNNLFINLLLNVMVVLLILLLKGTSHISAQQKSPASTPTSGNSEAAVTAFRERVKQYAKLREDVEGRLPKLSSDSKPEKIEAHQRVFISAVQAARAEAKPGDLFNAEIVAYIRRVIRTEFTGARMKELVETALKAQTKGVPVKVNAAYPETKEMMEMPPTLLLKLPELPKQLRYRFVGRNLLLVDREAQLTIDYMAGALP